MLEALTPEWLAPLLEKQPALWSLGALALVALLLAGCGAVGKGQSLPDAIADNLYMASSHEERAVRFCFASLAVAELVADRVTGQDRADAPAALGTIEVALAHIDALTDGSPERVHWTNADLYDASVALGRGVVAVNKRRLLGALTLGPDPARLFSALLAGGKAQALRLDFDRIWQDMTAGTIAAGAAVAICRARIDRNYGEVRAAAGLAAVGGATAGAGGSSDAP